MNDFLNFEIGDPIREVVVNNIEKTTVDMPDGRTSEKVCYTVEDRNGKTFQISDVWVEDHKGAIKIQGLWFTLSDNGQISPSSSLAKLMTYYNIKSLKDFIGQTVKVYPDKNDFLVLTSCDMTNYHE